MSRSFSNNFSIVSACNRKIFSVKNTRYFINVCVIQDMQCPNTEHNGLQLYGKPTISKSFWTPSTVAVNHVLFRLVSTHWHKNCRVENTEMSLSLKLTVLTQTHRNNELTQTHNSQSFRWVNSNSQLTAGELTREFKLIWVNSSPTLVLVMFTYYSKSVIYHKTVNVLSNCH